MFKKAGKAALVSVAVLVAADFIGSKLPAQLQVGGKDLRPYVAGAAAVFALMSFGGPVGVKA